MPLTFFRKKVHCQLFYDWQAFKIYWKEFLARTLHFKKDIPYA